MTETLDEDAALHTIDNAGRTLDLPDTGYGSSADLVAALLLQRGAVRADICVWRCGL
ncbi:MAG: hypothetical protein P4L56_17485 [Candidatus Sulfopaludibacter sp.]|nr:hypothetical protein [Candidatus Sulfopaludibacter sp.]